MRAQRDVVGLVFLVGFGVGCACGSDPDPDPDAPVDGPGELDAGTDAAAALTSELLPGDRTECAPWATLEPMPRGLPADPTPRELWRWSPLGGVVPDVFNPRTQPVALGLDGTVFTVAGNQAEHMVALNPDGTLRWTVVVGQVQGGPVALPDGRVAIGMFEGGVAVLDGATGVVERRLPGAFGTWILAGSGGRLYTVSGDSVACWCQDGGSLWELRLPPTTFPEIAVLANGDLRLSGWILGRGPLRVTPDGAVSEDPYPLPIAPNEGGTVSETDVSTMYVVVSNIDRYVNYYIASTAGTPWLVPDGPSIDGGGGGFLDALGGVWVWRAPREHPRTYSLRRYTGPDDLAFVLEDVPPSDQAIELAEDGSLVVSSGTVRRLMPEDGSVAWEVPRSVRAGTIGSAYGPNGVLYFGSTNGVFAVQTDVLPTDIEHCVIPGCNARNDGAVRLFR